MRKSYSSFESEFDGTLTILDNEIEILKIENIFLNLGYVVDPVNLNPLNLNREQRTVKWYWLLKKI